MAWGDGIAIGLASCGGVSILTCLWVIIVIFASRGSTIQTHRFLIHLSIANIGYAVYWVMPRYNSDNFIVERFGGAKDQCVNGTFCAENVCYFQGSLWFLSFVTLIWEMFLVAYAAYCCLKEAKGISGTAETLWSIAIWLLSLACGGVYVGDCISSDPSNYLEKSKATDRIVGFVWIGCVLLFGIVSTYIYFVKIKKYLHEVYISLFPDGANSLFWNDVQREIRRTLYQVRFKEIVTLVRPVVFYPFAFLLLTIPMIVYLSWSEVDLHRNRDSGTEEDIIKGVCFIILALRGFVTVFGIFALDKDNRAMLSPFAVGKAWWRSCCGKGKGKVGFAKTAFVHKYTVLHEDVANEDDDEDYEADSETENESNSDHADNNSSASKRNLESDNSLGNHHSNNSNIFMGQENGNTSSSNNRKQRNQKPMGSTQAGNKHPSTPQFSLQVEGAVSSSSQDSNPKNRRHRTSVSSDGSEDVQMAHSSFSSEDEMENKAVRADFVESYPIRVVFGDDVETDHAQAFYNKHSNVHHHIGINGNDFVRVEDI